MPPSIPPESAPWRRASWCAAPPVALVPQDDLETALRLCEVNEEEHVPVVDNAQDMRVIGEVRYQDLVLAYNRALLAARAAERGES